MVSDQRSAVSESGEEEERVEVMGDESGVHKMTTGMKPVARCEWLMADRDAHRLPRPA